jgi:CelD/BcsL family acetyltransferase involved in cellulose biosynthesis
MRITLINGRELSAEHVKLWEQMLNANPDLHSPYFRPEFTQSVAAVRRDVQVGVMEEANRLIGFFPFQRTAMGMGRPVGGALSDFQGVIAAPDAHWDAQELIRKCGLSLWDFDHLLESQTPFATYHRKTETSPYIDLSGGYENYARARREDGSEQIKKAGNLRRKLEREIGPIEFAAHRFDEATFQLLLNWKSRQYLSSGTTDIFTYDWTVALLRRLLEIQAADFAGMLSALSVKGRVIAAHLGMRSRRTWHYWFPSYDHEFAKLSPGLLLLLKMAEDAAALGINRIDLGKGESQYKNRLGSNQTMIAEGSVVVKPWASMWRKVRRETESWSETFGRVGAVPAKLLGRVDRKLRFR